MKYHAPCACPRTPQSSLGLALLLAGGVAARSGQTEPPKTPVPIAPAPTVPTAPTVQSPDAAKPDATNQPLEKGAPQPTAPAPETETVAEKTGKGKTLYSFRAEGLDLKTALALFARANNLNIAPDEDVIGQVTLDVHDLPLSRMLAPLLEAHDFNWTDEDGLIRVRAMETRQFAVDYLRLTRSGKGASSVTLSSATTGTGGGAGGTG